MSSNWAIGRLCFSPPLSSKSSSSIRQFENVQCVSALGLIDIRHELRSDESEDTSAGGYRNVLPSIYRVGNWIAMRRRRKTSLPFQFTGIDIERLEIAIGVTDERQASGCGQRAR